MLGRRFDNCDTFFREVFTKMGLCYTFNGLLPNQLYRYDTFVLLYFITKYGLKCFAIFRVFSTESIEDYRQAMILNWTIETGYPKHSVDWYPFHTNGGLYGEKVVLVLNDMYQEPSHYCDLTDGFEVILLKLQHY